MTTFASADFGGSESEDDDFNPQGAGSDDEEEAPKPPTFQSGEAYSRTTGDEKYDEDEGDKEGLEERRSISHDDSGRRRSNADEPNEDADADGEEDVGEEERDEEEEEDEDEEDEEDQVTGRPRKRRKRDPRAQFLDVEAEVDEGEEEEVEEDDDLPGEEMHPDDLADLPAGAERDDRKHRELDRQRDLAASLDAEKQAAALKERYGRNRAAPVNSVVVPQRLLLPSVEDPSIWRVKVKQGKEREVIMALQKRIEDRMGSRDPLLITAAFERGGGTMAASIYVEARREADVLAALDGLQFAYLGSKPLLVPIKEMPDLLRTRKTKPLEPGMYVRIKRGKHIGDLAMIEEVETNGVDVTLKIIPRLDYGLNEDASGPMVDSGAVGAAQKRKRQSGLGLTVQGARPPQRLFSESDAKKKHSRYLQRNGGFSNSWVYHGDTYVDGFLIKEFKSNVLQTEHVDPKLEEVTRFASGAEDGTENLDLSALAATLKNSSSADFLPGDTVKVIYGEQSGISGKAVSVHAEIVKIAVTSGALSGQTIEAPVKALRKLFQEGDHVKIIGGSKYFDEVGMVVKIKDDQVTLLADSNQKEITVFSKDLRVATDSGGVVGLTKFDLHDLVQLDAATVACVIKVDRDLLRILDQNGSVSNKLPSNISNKLERRKTAVATDREGSEIRLDDTIKEYGGEQKQGRVLHIHRNFIFAHNREQSENSGVFVVRTSNITVVAAKGGKVTSSGIDITKMNPAIQRNAANNAMAPPRTMGRDRLIGKTVKPRKGPYKGLLAIVKDTTDEEARLELHSKNKVITVKKDILTVIDPITGNSIDFRAGPRGPGAMPSRTPYGGATPGGRPSYGSASAVNGARTPAWMQDRGGKTPYAAAAGGRTPAWKMDQGGRTPGPSGGRTVYAGQTSYGGATSYGGQTSYGGISTWNPNGSATPYNAPTPGADWGNKTPAHHGNKTPAWQPSHMDAPTPGFNSAPTPGMDHPTPAGRYSGYGQYPTPGNVATPGGYPETPAPYTAETPGDDDGPRYD
ncbi:transcription elongation factor spt5 [Elasticomyces elasticus]|nr:transcription elongation factor spt5 [Elasticomyces elasticus]